MSGSHRYILWLATSYYSIAKSSLKLLFSTLHKALHIQYKEYRFDYLDLSSNCHWECRERFLWVWRRRTYWQSNLSLGFPIKKTFWLLLIKPLWEIHWKQLLYYYRRCRNIFQFWSWFHFYWDLAKFQFRSGYLLTGKWLYLSLSPL